MTAPGAAPEDETEEQIEAVNRRLRTYQRTGDPRFLWPTVDESARLAALGSIEHVVSAVLRGGAPAAPLGAADGQDAEAIGIAAFASTTGPLLGLWAETGRIAVSPAVALILAQHLAHGRARADRMERGVADALDILASSGIGCTVLKGYYTARRYYPEPGVRPMSDADLCVDPKRIREADQAFERAGWTAGSTQRRPYKRDWYPPAMDQRVRSLCYTHAWDPWRVELHDSLDRIFAPGRLAQFPRGPHDDEAWVVAGRSVRVLAQPLLLAHVAAHAAEEAHIARLLRVIEVVQIVQQDTAAGQLVWADFLSLVRATDTAAFVYPTLAFAERLVPGTIDAAVLAACASAAGPRVRAYVERSTPSGHVRLERVALGEKFLWTRGVGGVARRVAALVWPPNTPSFRAAMRIYARRVYRLGRGRVTLESSDPPPE